MNTTIIIVFIFGVILGFVLGNDKMRAMILKTKKTRNTRKPGKSTKKGNK